MYFKKLVKLVLVMYYSGHIGLIYTLEDFINTINIFKLSLMLPWRIPRQI